MSKNKGISDILNFSHVLKTLLTPIVNYARNRVVLKHATVIIRRMTQRGINNVSFDGA